MKKAIVIFLQFFWIAFLTSCSTYQYSSRHMNVNLMSVGTKPSAAEVVVDYSKIVTATSEYQITRNDAIKEAEYICILNYGIDVVVDPIYKVEYSSSEPKKKYKATITGFAGKFVRADAGVDAVKQYDMQDIEKYKMLTDPSFPKYYYNKETGDSYYFNSTGEAVAPKAGVFSSLASAPKRVKQQKVVNYDYRKAKRLRNTGIGLTVGGILSTFVIGLPCIMNSTKTYYNGYGYQSYYNSSASAAGIFFLTVGPAAVASGIPCWIVGSTRMKSSKNMAVSMGGTSNGVGLSLKF